MKDVDELQSFIKEGINIHFVDHYQQVFELAFPQLAQEQRDAAIGSLTFPSSSSHTAPSATIPVSASASSAWNTIPFYSSRSNSITSPVHAMKFAKRNYSTLRAASFSSINPLSTPFFRLFTTNSSLSLSPREKEVLKALQTIKHPARKS
jgi:hypothetical protein